MFEKIDCVVGSFSISVLLKGVADGFVWICTGMCGPNDVGLRVAFWVELDSVRARWSSTWCVLGDFKIIRYPVERLGCNLFSPAMFNFSDFIERNILVYLPLIRGEYTWFRDSVNPVMSRIDRVLVSTVWEEHFSNVIQRPLPCVVSDHCPILVEAGGMVRGKCPFKFENMWLKVEGFVDQIRYWWNSYHFVGSPNYALACKFKALKKDLKCWNKHVFRMRILEKKCFLSEL